MLTLNGHGIGVANPETIWKRTARSEAERNTTTRLFICAKKRIWGEVRFDYEIKPHLLHLVVPVRSLGRRDSERRFSGLDNGVLCTKDLSERPRNPFQK